MDLNAFIHTADPRKGFDSVGGQDNVEPTVPVTEPVETEIYGPKRSKKKRVTRGSERMPAASHPPKRLRVDYGTTGGSATGASLLGRAEAVRISVTGPSFANCRPLTQGLHCSVMTEATTVASATYSCYSWRSGSGFDAGSIRAEKATVRGMEHEQLFTEFNVSAARNLSLSSEVKMRAEYNILEKMKWRSLAEEKNILLEAKGQGGLKT
ncbi:hypothetical protein Tco_0612717 [Tanacetum coccineum]